MKEIVINWAEELVKSTILGNVETIEKEVAEEKLSTAQKAGGSLRIYKITSVVSRKLPIINFLTLNNEAVLTNDFVLKNMNLINDTQRDLLISLHHAMLSSMMEEDNSLNKLKPEDQIDALSQRLILGFSKIQALSEEQTSKVVKSEKLNLVKDNPLLLSIFALSLYKDAFFSVVLKVVDEIYRRE